MVFGPSLPSSTLNKKNKTVVKVGPPLTKRSGSTHEKAFANKIVPDQTASGTMSKLNTSIDHQLVEVLHLGLNATKLVLGVSDRVIPKPACSATETS